MANQSEITQRVVESILCQRLVPGERLGEQELADLFGVSRTLIREALVQLQTRGFVEVRSRRGWYVVEPSLEQAKDAFAARRIVEAGILSNPEETGHEGPPLQSVVRSLRKHLAREEESIRGTDMALRTFLLADFHVCLAEAMGHNTLCNILRDLTAHTSLVAALFQSDHDARKSCAEHAQIVDALEAGDLTLARRLMLTHIGGVEAALKSTAQSPARNRLSAALNTTAAPVRPRTAIAPTPSETDSTQNSQN
ncbi:MAG: GntR family transcriptional regulator [Proteobacteria bacterium]|nr:GntR family transcriptional regulator [Pseudomonadota bacterium]